ncbi:AAA family ATPase [Arthrobacter sp. SO5]|uniref:AAA family ATPase n=1 Tax=Arthrobacter sp. SO5 TaxID=1897055 RepID=UPI001E57D52D|nr:AAA family ATPase [Arthrobacter sp. SO5]
MTIVGPNNSGKTNLLRSIETFFTGHDNMVGYSVDLDSPNGSSAVRTSLVGTFEGDDTGADIADLQIYQALDRLFDLYSLERTTSSFPLYLSFSGTGSPVYAFFPNQRRPGDKGQQASISRIQRQLVTDLLSRFEIHYIPSAKSIKELYGDVLVPFMKAAVVRALEPQLENVKKELATVASKVTGSLKSAGIDNLHASFDFEGGSIENALSGFDFYMEDPFRTRLDRKGQGVQSAAFMATLLWVTEEEQLRGRSPIWLIEEPESYLHPGLTKSALSLLSKLSDSAALVCTTHSMAFVPQDQARVVGTVVEDGLTVVKTFTSHQKATEAIRKGLGVAFSDYFSFGERTVLVEGQTDGHLIRWFLAVSQGKEGCEWPALRGAHIADRGGASELAGFLRANYSLLRQERPVISLFDGDDAGIKAVNGLSGFFGNAGDPFVANREFVFTRSGFSIEGLFPDEWVLEVHKDSPNHFKQFLIDPNNALMGFAVVDGKKESVINKLTARAEQVAFEDWSERWRNLSSALDGALEIQAGKISTP